MGTGDARPDGEREGAVASGASTVERVFGADETPVGRLAAVGSVAMSVRELLALLLRTRGARESAAAVSARLITRFPSTVQLAQAGLPELIREGGLSLRQAAAVIAARELGRRLYAAPSARRPTVRTPADVAALVGPDMRYLDREHFKVVLLSTRHDVCGRSVILSPPNRSVKMSSPHPAEYGEDDYLDAPRTAATDRPARPGSRRAAPGRSR